jgi:hypothetical protein
VLITLTPSGTGAAAFTLGDDSVRIVPAGQNFSAGAGGGIKDGFLLKQERVVQQNSLVRAAYEALFPRYNLKNSLTFQVKRTFSSWELAVMFIAFHPDSIPPQGELTMTNISATGRISRYLPNAILQAAECVTHTGVTCEHRYTFLAPNPWQNAP